MAIKLLVADIDGTLVSYDKEISERNLAAIRAAQAKGVKVTLATGRMHASAVKYGRQANIELPLITCNGAMLKTCNGELVFEKAIEPRVVKEVIQYCLANQWHIHWYIDGELYLNEIDSDLWMGYDKKEEIKIHEVQGDFDHCLKRVVQLVVLNRSGQIESIAKSLTEKFGEYVFAPQTAAFCVDIVAKGIHKAVGVEFLAQKYNIEPHEIMAIGDSDNDVDMLKYAGIGVAMGNGFDSAKKVADAVTLSCEKDGFAVAVEKFILNKN